MGAKSLPSILLVIAIWLVTGTAQGELAWKAAYEGKELEKVREWEKEWVGKTIDSSNVDLVKDLLPKTLYDIMKDQEVWGSISFEIKPYKELELPSNYLENTVRNEGKCKVGPDGELLNYEIGLPFAHPKEAIEIMWNHNKKFNGDDFTGGLWDNFYVNRQNRQRDTMWDWGRVFFEPRYDLPPIENPGKLHYVENVGIHSPPDVKGMTFITFRYVGTTKEDDSWLYVPTMRRFRRLSVAQRSDSAGGADFTMDDMECYSARVGTSTYKLLGETEVLSPRHQDNSKITHERGQIYPITSGRHRERVKVYLIEVVSKDPHYNYSKKILWIDSEGWFALYADMYDQRGRLWKHMDEGYYRIPGSNASIGTSGGCLDLQRKHSSAYIAPKDFTGNAGMPAAVAFMDYWKDKLH